MSLIKSLWVSVLLSLLLNAQSGKCQLLTSDPNYFYSGIKTEKDVNGAIALLETSKADTNKIKLLNDLGKYFLFYSHQKSDNQNYRSSRIYLASAIKLSDSLLNDSAPGRFESHFLLAQALMMSGQIQKGENEYRYVIKRYRELNDRKGEAMAMFRLALSFNMQNIKATEAIQISEDAAVTFNALGDSAMAINAAMSKANALYNNLNLKDATNEIVLLIKKCKPDDRLLPGLMLAAGEINRYQGKLNIALQYSLNALRELKSRGDTLRIALYYGELALEYGDLANPTESIIYYKKCLYVREKQQADQFTIYRTASLMTSELLKVGRVTEALNILTSLKKRLPPHGELETAVMDQSLAYCYSKTGQFSIAEKYFISMITGYEKHEHDKEILMIAYSDVVEFFLKIKQYKRAESYSKNLLHYSSFASIANRMKIQLLLFKIDSAANNLPSAIAHLQLFQRYNDSVFNKTKSEQIEEIGIRYESEKKDKDIILKDQSIELLTQQGALQEATLKQATITRNAILAGTIMLILFIALLYNRYRIKTKSNSALQDQQFVISQKNKALELMIAEKEGLVREIHHRVKNNFQMVVGLMETQSSYIKNDEAVRALADSQNRIHTMSLIHQKLYQSADLSSVEMKDYIHELVRFLKDSFDTKNIAFVINSETIRLDVSSSLPIGLILNEAITNAIKYAFPEKRLGKIVVTFCHASPTELQLTVSDDGIGFSEIKKITDSTSMGIRLMKGLSEDISGNCVIESLNGTDVIVKFPYTSGYQEKLVS